MNGVTARPESLEAIKQRVADLDTRISERDSLDEKAMMARQDFETEKMRWQMEQDEILHLANEIAPKLVKQKAATLNATEKYLDAREALFALDTQYSAIVRRAHAAGVESDIPHVPSLASDGAQMSEDGLRVRRINRRLQEVRAW